MSATSATSATHRRPRRLFAACRRCHSQKIKCSGDHPCRSCVASDRAGECQFPAKERKITIPESYLRRLEADSRRLQTAAQNPTPESQGHGHRSPGGGGDDNLNDDEGSMLNPLFDGGQPDDRINEPASEPGFIGEASCAAFSNRLLQCLDDNYTPCTAGFSNYYRIPTGGGHHHHHHHRGQALDEGYHFPERMHAKLLLNVARRFIGNYHPLFLEVTYMRELDAVYRREMTPSTLWLCKFYALMSLGEIYTNRRGVGDNNRVPGTDYYVRAVNMLQEGHEEPSLMQIEVLTLLAWASNILGRVRTAHCYSGTAMRLALSMGMHRAASRRSHLSPVEREARRRTWWVLYFFERFSASKLGQPITVRDEDIDTEMPSMDGLTEDEMAEFLDPVPLITNVKLARIIGNILTDIYGIPRSNKGLCIHGVHGILKQLRAWHAELPPGMRIKERGSPRPVASLHLAYNQCIIQTTRPVLLHLFKTQFQLLGSKQDQQQQQQQSPRKQTTTTTFSSITLALAESCVNAAQASSRIVEGLFLDGSIATFGYWDAHHIFSAALILIMSAVMKPATATSEALETLLSILRSMKNDGNIPAVDLCDRLSHIQARVSTLREQGRMEQVALLDGAAVPGGEPSPGAVAGTGDAAGAAAVAAATGAMAESSPGHNNTNNNNNHGEQQAMPMALGGGFLRGAGGASINYGGVDILGNPLIGSFLDETRGPWPDAVVAEDGSWKEFASEIEEQFLFHNM